MSLTDEITADLYDYLLKKTNPLVCLNNWHMQRWEMDIVCVTQKLLLKEYEIKVSRSDFLAEKKSKKHKHTLYQSTRNARKDQMDYVSMHVPNLFYYVCPNGLISASEIPEYAGLYYYDDGKYSKFTLEKAAPRIHSIKTKDKVTDNINHCMSWRISTQLKKISQLKKELHK